MRGREAFRNVMRWARGLTAAIVAQDVAHHFLGFSLPAWMLWADERLAQVIVLAFCALLAWSLHGEVRDVPARLAARREERRLERDRWMEDAERHKAALLAGGMAMAALQAAHLQAALMQNSISMQAVYSGYRGGLRYLGPPAVGTGPLPHVTYELVPSVIEEGVVVGSRLQRRELPAISDAHEPECGKCGYPLGAHAYYGNGPCLIACWTGA